MSADSKRLLALQKKATEKGQWPLVASIECVLKDESVLDHRINVLGAMHEVGLLRNSLEPWWNAWRSETDAFVWTQRCIERLLNSDSDYWAVAGLLGLPLSLAASSIAQFNFQLLSIRYASSWNENVRHIAVFFLKRTGNVISPVLEVGWDSITGEIVDMTRWRAVTLNQESIHGGNIIAKCSGAYFLCAKLPYGGWRIHHDDFALEAEQCVPKDKTFLSNYS